MRTGVIGRRLFDLTNSWNGRPPVGDAVFVLTHEPSMRYGGIWAVGEQRVQATRIVAPRRVEAGAFPGFERGCGSAPAR